MGQTGKRLVQSSSRNPGLASVGKLTVSIRKIPRVSYTETAFNSGNKFENQIVHFSGSKFDEIRFTEAGAHQGFFGLDNMAWKLAAVEAAPPAGEVALPGSVALLGIGMMGLGFMRKKQK
jgi:hypothetical protein